MKKYKLIKKFPGSPEINVIAESDSTGTYLVKGGVLIYMFTKEQIENYPEFWEEVKEEKFVTVYGVNESFTKTASSFKHKIKQDFAAGNWQWFETEEERDKYVENFQPRFSKDDMLSFETYCRMYQPRTLAFEKFMESKR